MYCHTCVLLVQYIVLYCVLVLTGIVKPSINMDKGALYDGLSRQLVDLHASMAKMQGNLERAMDVSKKTHRMSHAFLGVYVAYDVDFCGTSNTD